MLGRRGGGCGRRRGRGGTGDRLVHGRRRERFGRAHDRSSGCRRGSGRSRSRLDRRRSRRGRRSSGLGGRRLLGGRRGRCGERLAQAAGDGCFDGGGRALDELAHLAQLGEQILTGDAELFRKLVNAGLAGHLTPFLRPAASRTVPLDGGRTHWLRFIESPLLVNSCSFCIDGPRHFGARLAAASRWITEPQRTRGPASGRARGTCVVPARRPGAAARARHTPRQGAARHLDRVRDATDPGPPASWTAPQSQPPDRSHPTPRRGATRWLPRVAGTRCRFEPGARARWELIRMPWTHGQPRRVYSSGSGVSFAPLDTASAGVSGSASLWMSIRQPVSRAASRAF